MERRYRSAAAGARLNQRSGRRGHWGGSSPYSNRSLQYHFKYRVYRYNDAPQRALSRYPRRLPPPPGPRTRFPAWSLASSASDPGCSLAARPALLSLSVELRVLIYEFLFTSTRLLHGTNILPARHSLALLRTCRQVAHEVGRSWIGQVLFDFDDPVAMLNNLVLRCPAEMRPLVKNVRVKDCPSRVHNTTGTLEPDLSSALDMVFNLGSKNDGGKATAYRLYRLTIIAMDDFLGRNRVLLEDLAARGIGWQQLWYISGHPGAIIDELQHRYLEESARQFFPDHYRRALEARDGCDSGVSVEVYAYRAGHPAERIRELETCKSMHTEAWETDYVIIMKRGEGVDIGRDVGPREPTPWGPSEIKAFLTSRSTRVAGCFMGSYKSRRDIYDHPEEIPWSQWRYTSKLGHIC